MEKKKCTAVVLAAGSGSRMQSSVAKQYMLLKDRPLVWYALHAVEASSVIDDCILVTGAEDISYAREEIVARFGFRKVSAVTAGGKERYDSVYNALRIITDQSGYVFIQDGARPFLTEDILKRCYEAVEECHACAVGMPVKDTIKIADGEGFAAQTPDRAFLWQIQTPQVFDTRLILSAYEKLMRERENLAREGISVTDDAMVVERFARCKVKLVRGSYENIKITTPEDMEVAKAFLQR